MRFLAPILSRYGSIVIQFIMVAVVTNALDSHGAGIYFMILGLILSTYFIAGLGIPDGIIKIYTELEERGERYRSNGVLLWALVFGWISALFFGAMFGLILHLYLEDSKLSFFAAVWWISYGSIFVSSQVLIASGRIKFGSFTFYSAINFVSFSISTPWIFYSESVRLDNVIAVMSISSLIAALITSFAVSKCVSFNLTYINQIDLRKAIKLGTSISSGRVVQAVIIWSPVWISGAIISTVAAAEIGLSLRLASAVTAVLAAIRFSIRPYLAKCIVNDRWFEIERAGSEIAFWTSALSIISIILSLSISQYLIPQIFGEQYHGVWIIISIILIGSLAESFGGPVDETLKLSGQENYVLKCQVISLVIGCILQTSLSFILDAYGVASGYSLTFLILYLSLIIRLKNTKGIIMIAKFPNDIFGKYARWIRYFRYVPFSKVLGKVHHRVKTRKLILNPSKYLNPIVISENPFASKPLTGFSNSYHNLGNRFVDVEKLVNGVFVSKKVVFDFGSIENISWDYPFGPDKTKIHWWHDLAFFSFSIPLAEKYPELSLDVLHRLIHQLEKTHPISSSKKIHFVWSPIAVSLRIMGLSCAMSIMSKTDYRLDPNKVLTIVNHINLCYGILNQTSEKYLGYNHHVFGETALVVGAIALGISPEVHLESAISGISAHTLADGFWSERSPTYHIHMLMLARCIKGTDLINGETLVKLEDLIAKMQLALNCVVHPDGEIAIFNDAAIDDAVRPEYVGWTHGEKKLDFLPEAGFCRISSGDITTIFDAGPMGPNDVIGHGHGDFLSIEVSVGTTRLFVDPGVRSIDNDDGRRWTRSSDFHNGPSVEGEEPAEFFGAWRVGRRGSAKFLTKPKILSDGTIQVSGVADGYSHVVGSVTRSLSQSIDGNLTVSDHWEKNYDGHAISSFIISDQWVIISQVDNSYKISSLLGDIVSIKVISGEIKGNPLDICYYPSGPMLQRSGSLMQFKPDNYGNLEILVSRVNCR